MTRVNVIPVSELSDQWLLAEYRELPRCIKQDINTSDAPVRYCLGKGHMKWAKAHSLYLFDRYYHICREMRHRGFSVNYSAIDLCMKYLFNMKTRDCCRYKADETDITINRTRLIEKYKLKPDFYKWTKRDKPNWIMKG